MYGSVRRRLEWLSHFLVSDAKKSTTNQNRKSTISDLLVDNGWEMEVEDDVVVHGQAEHNTKKLVFIGGLMVRQRKADEEP